MNQAKPDFDQRLTHQSLSDKFDSPFDLVLHAIQLVREQIALQASGTVLPAGNLAEHTLHEIASQSQERIQPLFDFTGTARMGTTAPSARDEARRASVRKKRRMPRANQRA